MDKSVSKRLARLVALAGFYATACFGVLAVACHGQTNGNVQSLQKESEATRQQTTPAESTQQVKPEQNTELRPVSKPPVPRPDLQQLINSENQFALKMVQAIAPQQETNFVISPYGVFECLNLVKTAGSPLVDAEIAQSLGLPPGQLFASELSLLGRSFDLNRNTNAVPSPANGDRRPSPTQDEPKAPVETLPSFVSKTVCVQDSRLTMVPEAKQQIFEPLAADFVAWDRSVPTGAEQARNSVDQIFAEATSGRLTQLGYSPPEDDTLFALVNLCFFDGLWLKPFEPSVSKDGPFVTGYDANGTPTQATARFMCDDSRRVFYFENNAFQLVELPYRDSILSMVLVLPSTETTMAEALDSVARSKCLGDRTQSPRQVESVRLEIPKFSFKTRDIDLKSLCQAVGISKAFTPEAGFERLFAVTTPIGIGSAKQNAFVELDEKGTRAAAITEMNMIPMSAPPPSKKSFIANRPFLFFVTDTRGVILFAGRVSNPAPAE
jgi:serine protease inhibitor